MRNGGERYGSQGVSEGLPAGHTQRIVDAAALSPDPGRAVQGAVPAEAAGKAGIGDGRVCPGVHGDAGMDAGIPSGHMEPPAGGDPGYRPGHAGACRRMDVRHEPEQHQHGYRDLVRRSRGLRGEAPRRRPPGIEKVHRNSVGITVDFFWYGHGDSNPNASLHENLKVMSP